MCQLKLSIVQMDIAWENKQANICSLREKLKELRGKTDIVVLPEMFSTGFTMQSHRLAEPVTGDTILALKDLTVEYRFAITGSYIAVEDTIYYNRAFFITPEGGIFFYDKRHLFCLGDEAKSFSKGDRKVVVSYRGWNICLLICYDLRFPVWSRNVSNEYDLLICMANWPASRRRVWDTLLQARAMENVSYVCGVNRIGIDGNYIHYNGGSAVYSAKGETLIGVPDDEEFVETVILELSSLQQFRREFPVWKDADLFARKHT
ncbi:omega-amidase [termite gut metagenome]|uniref:Omega-amidase n=1 Tax=termite gut metagenome TaxID=433724 RepID=A0A5J4SFV3_9ZZZZ